MLDKLNQVEKARHNRRKTAKSPINIRNKIRQLQFQMEKHQRLKQGQKRMNNLPLNLLTHPTSSPAHMSPRDQNIFRNKVYFKSEQKKQAVAGKNDRPPLTAQQVSQRQINSIRRNQENTRRLHSPQPLTRRQSDNESARRFQQKQQGQQEKIYQNLIKENQRYKDIYSQSVEKLHHLEEKLQTMKQEHQHEKLELQSLIYQLRNKVENKKTNNLAHIYSYDVKNNNFLIVKDKIITQTDNQNSSSHLESHKQRLMSPVVSLLSTQSK